jgi:hypothetical protein
MPRRGPSPTAPAEAAGPVHALRHGRIRAAIWRNQTEKGAMYDVKVSRSYREGNEWRDSFSFGYTDLLVVAKLMYDAHSYISMLRAKEHTSARSSSGTEPAR